MPKEASCKHWDSLPGVLAPVLGRGNVWEAALPGDMDEGKNYLAAKSHCWVRSEACCCLSTRPHKDSTCNAVDTGELGSIPGSGRSLGGGTWQPTPVFLLEKSHGQKSLVDYGPKGLKESDVTEQLSTHRETEPTPVTGSVIPPLWLPSLPVFLPHAPVSISWDYFPNKLFTPSILSLISAFRETQIKTLPREMKGTKLCYENVYLNNLNKVSLWLLSTVILLIVISLI